MLLIPKASLEMVPRLTNTPKDNITGTRLTYPGPLARYRTGHLG